LNWHVVITKPSFEEIVAKKLSLAAYNVFYPKIKKYYFKLKKEKTIPLFNRYIFVKFDYINDFKFINYTKGVSKILCFLNTPAIIDENIIINLKQSCDANNVITPKYYKKSNIRLGDKVKINTGVFEGLEAIVSGLYDNKERIEIFVNLIKISLNKNSVSKIDALSL